MPSGGGAETGDGTTSTTTNTGLAVGGLVLIGVGAVAGGIALRRRSATGPDARLPSGLAGPQPRLVVPRRVQPSGERCRHWVASCRLLRRVLRNANTYNLEVRPPSTYNLEPSGARYQSPTATVHL